MGTKLTNVLFAGIGGQGIIKASDMLTEAAFRFSPPITTTDGCRLTRHRNVNAPQESSGI